MPAEGDILSYDVTQQLTDRFIDASSASHFILAFVCIYVYYTWHAKRVVLNAASVFRV